MWRNYLVVVLLVVFTAKLNVTIYVPGDDVTKKPSPNFGLKTLHWQNPNGERGDLQIHHNYSKVNVQKGNSGDQTFLNQNHDDGTTINNDPQNRSARVNYDDSFGGSTFENAPILEVPKSHEPIVTYFEKKPRHTEAFSKCPKMATGQFVYELSCNQFLSCWKGRGYVQNCSPGTLFNPKTLECDHAEKVECVSGPRNAPDEGVFSGKIQANCPKGFSGLIPHYSDCTKFFNCLDGRQISMTCPPGTNFDVKTNNCDFPEKSTCVGTKKGRSTEKGEDSLFCGGLTGVFAHPDDCSKYFNCTQSGEEYVGQCVGKLYNHLLKKCDFAYNVNCDAVDRHFIPQNGYERKRDPLRKGYSDNQYENKQGSYNRSFKRNFNSKDLIEKDLQGGLHKQTFVKDNSFGGRYQNNQNYGGGVFNSPNPVPQGSLNEPGSTQYSFVESVFCGNLKGIFAHPKDCAKYFNCTIPGSGFVVHCQNGFFNHLLNRCDLVQNVDCQSSDRNVFNQQHQEQESRATTNDNFELAAADPKCPQYAQGLFAHPGDCSKFLNCANGMTFIQDCAPGTLFNSVSKICDFPANVICGNSNKNLGGSPQNSYPPNAPTKIVDTQNLGKNQFHLNTPDLVPNQNLPSQNLYPVYSDQSRIPKVGVQNQNLGTNQNGFGQQLYPITVQTQQQIPQTNPFVPNLDQSQYYQNVGSYQYPQINTQPVNINPNIGFDVNKYQNVGSGLNTYQNLGLNKYPLNQNPQNLYPSQNVNQYGFGPLKIPSTNHQNPLSVDGTKLQNQKPPNDRQILNEHSQNRQMQTQNVYPSNTDQVQHPHQKSKQWPPPFPSTDVNADYVFDYEDAVPLESTISKNEIERKPCEPNDFKCGPNECIPQKSVCDGTKDCQDGSDELDCTKYMEMFQLSQNSKLAVREQIKIRNSTLFSCAKRCVESQDFQCRSFNYRRHDGLCLLSDSNVGLSGMLIIYRPFDYYENRKFSINCTGGFKCPNDKCLGKNQICDGQDDCGDRTDEKNCNAGDLGYEVRLAGSHFDNEGRIEVTVFGKTGFVCDDKFGLKDADVACRELGFPLGAVEVKGHSYFAPEIKNNDTFFMMDDVTCAGNETSLRDCDFNGWGVHNCLNQEIVGVVCKTPLEQCPDDFWKCDSGQECLPLAFVCDGVTDCSDGSDESDPHCEAPIELRLVNGTRPSEGRVEIKYHGTWGTICDDDFNEDAAKVVCRYFGYRGTATVRKDGFYGPGKGPIWLDQVYCQGNETYVQDCTHWNWGEHNCEHSEDVGVICSNFDISGSERKAKVEVVAPFVSSGTISRTYKPKSCGLRNDDLLSVEDDVHFRVVKGSAAKKGQYPWQASIRVKGKSKPAHWCGAVVISDKFLLTAAHCLIGFSKGAYLVVAGDYNVDDEEGTEQQAYIEDFYIHEEFRKDHRMNNDIALIKLKGTGFVLTKDIQPICLPEYGTTYDKDLNCTISGFGSIQSGKSAYSHDLRAGWIPIQSEEVCKMPHVYGSAITPGMFCAGSLEEGVDACDGDSGGPLACLKDGLFTLYGLTSWGQHCGHANKPGVYVKISHYRKWIDDIIKKHS